MTDTGNYKKNSGGYNVPVTAPETDYNIECTAEQTLRALKNIGMAWECRNNSFAANTRYNYLLSILKRIESKKQRTALWYAYMINLTVLEIKQRMGHDNIRSTESLIYQGNKSAKEIIRADLQEKQQQEN